MHQMSIYPMQRKRMKQRKEKYMKGKFQKNAGCAEGEIEEKLFFLIRKNYFEEKILSNWFFRIKKAVF